MHDGYAEPVADLTQPSVGSADPCQSSEASHDLLVPTRPQLAATEAPPAGFAGGAWETAGNPNTPSETLAQLANDPELYAPELHVYVRTRVAENPNTPSETLAQLANNPDSNVRRSVAANPNTPGDILALLANDPDGDVREWVAANPNTSSEPLTQLANDPDRYVREFTAGNPDTSSETLAQLANDPDSNVRRNVAANPNTPGDILALLAYDPDGDVRRQVAANSNTPSETLAQLANDPDSNVRRNVAANPNTPGDLVLVLGVSQYPEILFDSYLCLTTEALSRISEIYASSETVSEITVLLAFHPFTPLDVIEQLAESEELNTRVAVSSSPTTPEQILNNLTVDNHPDVRRAATKELERR